MSVREIEEMGFTQKEIDMQIKKEGEEIRNWPREMQKIQEEMEKDRMNKGVKKEKGEQSNE